MEHLLQQGTKLDWTASHLHLRLHNCCYGFNGGVWKSCFPYNRLILILNDCGHSYYEDGEHILSVKTDSLFLIPAYHEVIHHQSPSMHHISLHFSVELYAGADLLTGLSQCRIVQAPDLKKWICPILDAQEEFTVSAALNAFGWIGLVRLCGKEVYESQAKKDGFSHYEHLLSYLEKHCCAGITVSDMAEIMHMNPETFCKKFTADTGSSPKDFFNHLLAAKAENMLLHTDKTIREIAWDLKFCNEFYFSRFFARYLHISPQAYRKKKKT